MPRVDCVPGRTGGRDPDCVFEGDCLLSLLDASERSRRLDIDGIAALRPGRGRFLGAPSVTTAEVDGTTYLVQRAGADDDGISVFGADGNAGPSVELDNEVPTLAEGTTPAGSVRDDGEGRAHRTPPTRNTNMRTVSCRNA
jgi:hypothetical protein